MHPLASQRRRVAGPLRSPGTGHPEEAHLGIDSRFPRTIAALRDLIHPEDLARASEHYERLRKADEPVRIDFRVVRPNDHETRWVALTGEVERDLGGRAVQMFGCVQDITDRKLESEALVRANRALKVPTESNQAVVRATSEEELLLRVCQIAVEEGGYRLAWVGSPEDDAAKSVRPVAWAGAGFSYITEARITWADEERGRGPSGLAIRTGRPQICRDTAHDPAFAPWRANALAHGFASSGVFPMQRDDELLGVLTVYSDEVNRFDEAETKLLAELADDLAVGLRLLRTRASHREAVKRLSEGEARLRLALRATQQGIYDLNVQTGETITSPEYALMLGFDPEDFHESNAAWIERLHPDDRESAAKGYRDYIAGRVPEYRVEFRQRTKSGDWKWILSLGSLVERDSTGAPLRMLGTHTDITERKANEEALARQARPAAAMLELPRTTEHLNEADLLEFARKLAETVTGSTKSFLQISPPEQGHAAGSAPPVPPPGAPPLEPGAERLRSECLRTRQPVRKECPDRRAEHCDWQCHLGVPVLENSQIVLLVGMAGKPRGYTEEDLSALQLLVDTVWNLVRRRRADAEVQNTLAYLSTLIEASPIGIISYDESGDAQTANEAAARCSGGSVTELLAQNFRQIPSWKSSGMLAAAEVALATRKSTRLAGDFMTSFGRSASLQVQFVPFQRGDRWHLLTLIRDVAEEKRINAQLELQASALDSAAKAIVITDVRGTIRYVNSAFTTLTGYEADEAIGKNPRVLKSGDHPAAFYRELWQTVLGGATWHGELRNRRKDGTSYDEDMTITPVKDAAGRTTHFIAIKQDITERKLLEKQYLRAQRMESVGLLAGGIAHDLNNVLAPIGMGLELLQLVPLPPNLKPILESMALSTKRGAEIVKQVLTFARGTDGERALVQLRHLVKDIVRMANETFPRSIHIQDRLPAVLWPLLADPTQLHQVLLNLSVNARDAMPSGGKLTFEARNLELDPAGAAAHPGAKPGHYVLLAVSDTGTGMSPETLDRIFEPFFTTKAQGHGTGLGLPTVLGIIRSHGGFVEVASRPGKGTTFSVYLPANPSGQEAEPPAPSAPLPSGAGETILLVDDEPNVLTITRGILEAHSYKVLTAEDGAAAVAMYARHPGEIALVLTDLMMPVLDGISLIHALRRIEPKVRIITSSGLSSQPGQIDRREELRALGIRHHLEKPYGAEALLRALDAELPREE